MSNSRNGFTLVEVLIVVIIIAILASLIVPRMLMQTDKAKAAEALQMVGAIKRAAERYYDLHSTYLLPNGSSEILSGGSFFAVSFWTGNWTDLGLSGIENSKNWTYHYTGQAASFQISISGSSSNQMVYDSDMDNWTCNSPFKPVDSNAHPQKCTV